MRSIGSFEAKTHFSSLLQKVEEGEQVIITKHGRPVAKLIPAFSVNKAEIKLTIEKIKKFNRSHFLKLDWKVLRDEGRRS
ncbi:MAG: prevent-host-death protein [Gammaproteobacteria bacterium RIFCSPHIGHO2_12_38_15]|nr:MAG: prevent-host-death protein [Gammaproteobacteria bacterium RIFCSPHIGHO2_12_38_15]